jgi:hypothetical protein
MSHRALQLAVRDILRHPQSFEWSVQGFGLLRLYFGEEGRLHVWAPCLRYDNVSTIHDHSWHLRSTIVFGKLQNKRFVDCGPSDPTHYRQQVVTGYNARLLDEPQLRRLAMHSYEVYRPGDEYSQRAEEIHETIADPYTITLMERDADKDGIANLYWSKDTTWGTAKPRKATPEEVERVTQRALKQITELK